MTSARGEIQADDVVVVRAARRCRRCTADHVEIGRRVDGRQHVAARPGKVPVGCICIHEFADRVS